LIGCYLFAKYGERDGGKSTSPKVDRRCAAAQRICEKQDKAHTARCGAMGMIALCYFNPAPRALRGRVHGMERPEID